MRSAVTTDLLLDATGLNYFWYNEATVSANGDLHYQAGTQDSGAGIYAHRVDGTNPTVARTRDPLPSGEWMIMPLDINSGPALVRFTSRHTQFTMAWKRWACTLPFCNRS